MKKVLEITDETQNLISIIKQIRQDMLNNGVLYSIGRDVKPNDPTQLIMLYDTLLEKITKKAA